MRRATRTSILLLFLVGGCSYSSQFAVANLTNAPLVVRLVFAREHGRCPLDALSINSPRVVPTKKVKDGPAAIQSEPAGDVNSSGCSIDLQVPTGHSAVATRIRGYSDDFGIGEMPIEIQMDGEAGRVHIQGEKIDRLFERRSRYLYVFDYGRPAA